MNHSRRQIPTQHRGMDKRDLRSLVEGEVENLIDAGIMKAALVGIGDGKYLI